MKLEECEKHEKDLRDVYIKSDPIKRLGVIKQRIKNPDGRPNMLVVYVSAVEAMARSIVLDLATHEGFSRVDAYQNVQFIRAKDLLEKICGHQKVGRTTDEIFGSEHFQNFLCAEKYRNLLVHECTYLKQEVTTELIESTQKILDRLEAFYPKSNS